ncbi:hypothetical protein [Ammonifex thiophilus]|uniref:Uncharacterized protein n=1 Tax=Ammonifex thiophilus TaxID=444093 RepID=A0A3D8P2S4_9THEO|nr:hypothetical protein [Ammonifex thiophilus]RDV82865.1 hypothetical protein DXX99_06575 [Ammonifex thiophilus]
MREKILWFKPKEAGRWVRAGVPTCTIGKTLSLNVVSARYIKPPTRANVGLDLDQKLLIIKEDPEHGELKVEAVNRGKSGKIVSRTLLRWLKSQGLSEGRYLGHYDEELKALVFPIGEQKS